MIMEKLLVTKSSMPPIEEYVAEIKDLFESHWLTNMGAKHEKLEKGLTDYLKVPNLALTCNGHTALELAIQVLNLFGEVITTPYTFASTTHAIVRSGLTPVFCDVREEDCMIDTSRIEALITDKTCAILPVHVYGNICDVNAIQKIADRYNLKVLYDAAHTFGIKKDGVGIGSFGDASVYSFHATKVFHTIEGGAIVLKNQDLLQKLNSIRNFGIVDEETISYVGANGKMNEFQAAMGLCNLLHIDEEIARRKRVYERYCEHLLNVSGLRIIHQTGADNANYIYMPILIDPDIFGASRDEVALQLRSEEIYARKYFYPITSCFGSYIKMYESYPTPVALKISQQVLTLPMYADLSLESVDRICMAVLRCKR